MSDDTTFPMDEQAYNAATQGYVDAVCHYRNLAIKLGATPEFMRNHYDRWLCEKGVSEAEAEDWVEASDREDWEENERMRSLLSRTPTASSTATDAAWLPCRSCPTTRRSGSMPRPTDHALRQVGQRITWTQTEPVKRRVEGVCMEAQFTGSTVSNERGTFPGVRFLIKPDKGRAVWTCTFADEGDDTDG